MILKNIYLRNIYKNILETFIGRDEFNPMVIWSLAAVAYISWDTSVKEILEIPFPIEMNLCHWNINDCCFLKKVFQWKAVFMDINIPSNPGYSKYIFDWSIFENRYFFVLIALIHKALNVWNQAAIESANEISLRWDIM